MSSQAAAELRREHARLRTGISRVRDALAAPGEAGAALAAAARGLLPELFQHEAAEPPRLDALLAGRAGAARLKFRAEGEHLTLRSLARDLQFVLEHPQLYAFDHRARLTRALADALAAHLDFEEAELLPPAA